MMRLKFVFAFLLMIFATFSTAVASSLSVDRGPSITAVTDFEGVPLPVGTDSLLIAEFAARFNTIDIVVEAARTFDSTIFEVLQPAIVEVGVRSDCMLADSTDEYARVDAICEQIQREGVARLGCYIA